MGEPFMVETALELGLISRVLPPAEVNAYAQQQAQKMARKPLASLVQTKRLMKSARTPAVLSQMDEEAAVFSRMLKEPAAIVIQQTAKIFLRKVGSEQCIKGHVSRGHTVGTCI